MLQYLYCGTKLLCTLLKLLIQIETNAKSSVLMPYFNVSILLIRYSHIFPTAFDLLQPQKSIGFFGLSMYNQFDPKNFSSQQNHKCKPLLQKNVDKKLLLNINHIHCYEYGYVMQVSFLSNIYIFMSCHIYYYVKN